MADLKGLQLDPQTLIILLIIAALLGIGYGVGNYQGVKGVESEIIDQNGQTQSLTGTVQSTNKNGFALKADQGDNWTVKYGKQKSISDGTGSSDNQSLSKGDKVQVSGTPIGQSAVVAQSITKVVPPTPQPKESPAK